LFDDAREDWELDAGPAAFDPTTGRSCATALAASTPCASVAGRLRSCKTC